MPKASRYSIAMNKIVYERKKAVRDDGTVLLNEGRVLNFLLNEGAVTYPWLLPLFHSIKSIYNHIQIRKTTEDWRELQQSLSTLEFKKENETLRLHLPRSLGNSLLAMMLFLHYDKSIMIVFNNSTKELISRNLKQLFDTLPEEDPEKIKKRIFSSTEIKSLVASEASMVIVDPWYTFSAEQENTVYHIRSDFFVFIG